MFFQFQEPLFLFQSGDRLNIVRRGKMWFSISMQLYCLAKSSYTDRTSFTVPFKIRINFIHARWRFLTAPRLDDRWDHFSRIFFFVSVIFTEIAPHDLIIHKVFSVHPLKERSTYNHWAQFLRLWSLKVREFFIPWLWNTGVAILPLILGSHQSMSVCGP